MRDEIREVFSHSTQKHEHTVRIYTFERVVSPAVGRLGCLGERVRRGRRAAGRLWAIFLKVNNRVAKDRCSETETNTGAKTHYEADLEF